MPVAGKPRPNPGPGPIISPGAAAAVVANNLKDGKKRAAFWPPFFLISARMKILGILNITDDSFSDGGKYLAPAAALFHAQALAHRAPT